MIRIVIFLFCATALFTLGCGNFDYQKSGGDVPTQGNLVVAVDHGDSFFMEQVFDLFVYNYPDAHFNRIYLPESEILQLANNDSAKVLVLNRDLNDVEKQRLKDRKVMLRSVRIAYSSMALIVNRANAADQLTHKQLVDILEGKIADWSEIGGSGPIVAAFDHAGGHNYLFLRSLTKENKMGVNASGTLGNPNAVVKYVAENPGAIGFVSMNTIADAGYASSLEMNRSVKVLKMQNAKGEYALPYQSQVAAKEYPYIQEIFIHNLQGYDGLAVGLMAFMSSQPGQTLVKKCGLLPALPVGRTIKIEEE